MSSKYITVTDPSYILPAAIYDECWEKCKQLYGNNGDNIDWDHYHSMLADALTEFSGAKAWVASTGFGDWDNTMYGPAVVQSEFTADAGMMCVCEITEPVKAALSKLPEHCYAIIDIDRVGIANVNFNTKDPNWHVVEITDNEGNEWFSEYPDDEDDDE